jgi:hypothetical protein
VTRSRSNVERIRRPLTVRHLVRAVLVLAGIVGGIAVAWAITPRGDVLAFDAGLVRGALLGAVVGLGVAAFVPLRDAPVSVVRPRPSGFDALRAELEAERARGDTATDAATDAATERADAVGDAGPDAPMAEQSDADGAAGRDEVSHA